MFSFYELIFYVANIRKIFDIYNYFVKILKYAKGLLVKFTLSNEDLSLGDIEKFMIKINDFNTAVYFYLTIAMAKPS